MGCWPEPTTANLSLKDDDDGGDSLPWNSWSLWPTFRSAKHFLSAYVFFYFLSHVYLVYALSKNTVHTLELYRCYGAVRRTSVCTYIKGFCPNDHIVPQYGWKRSVNSHSQLSIYNQFKGCECTQQEAVLSTSRDL